MAIGMSLRSMTVQRAIPRVSQFQDVQGRGFGCGQARRHVHLRGEEETNRKCNRRRRTRDLVPGAHRSLFLKTTFNSEPQLGSFRSIIREKSAICVEDLFMIRRVCSRSRDKQR